jgi:hypothetical protein
VRDDGAGFNPRILAGPGSGGRGLGLGGMAERARLAGGELDVRSAPGGGYDYDDADRAERFIYAIQAEACSSSFSSASISSGSSKTSRQV